MIEDYVQLITLGVRKQFKKGSFGSRSLMALSHREFKRQTANRIAYVQQSPSATSEPVPPDGPSHLNCTTCHTTPSSLEEMSIMYSPLTGDAIRLLHIHPSLDETLGLEADLVLQVTGRGVGDNTAQDLCGCIRSHQNGCLYRVRRGRAAAELQCNP